MTLYRETERAFSEGDRVQFTAPYKEQHIANRELGAIEKMDANGNGGDSTSSITAKQIVVQYGP